MSVHFKSNSLVSVRSVFITVFLVLLHVAGLLVCVVDFVARHGYRAHRHAVDDHVCKAWF